MYIYIYIYIYRAYLFNAGSVCDGVLFFRGAVAQGEAEVNLATTLDVVLRVIFLSGAGEQGERNLAATPPLELRCHLSPYIYIYIYTYIYRTCPVQKVGCARSNQGRATGRDLVFESAGEQGECNFAATPPLDHPELQPPAQRREGILLHVDKQI